MYIDPADHRPRSLFDRGTLEPAQLVTGAVVALIVHFALPLFVVAIVALLAVIGVTLTPPPPELPPVEQVIQARFLQLGEEIDPRDLPNRRVPILRTDVAEPAPSKRAPTEPPPPRPERQPNAVPDLLQRLSDTAQTFAEREEARVLEGDPDGIEGGEREASEGSLYNGRLSSFFRRGWQVPTTIDRDSLRTLVTRVSVGIGEDLRVQSFRIVRSSGNPDYDLAVEQQLQRLIDGQAVIPPPPEEVASDYLGREVGFNYTGRDAR
ncbi:MAG: TonB C-terminal domain-containing protein [Myxococcota bacterium]|nr:TonB C-terminal domain-containing protein [Myxococcota bacterium]